MALSHSPSITTKGLVLYLDAANSKSFANTGTTWTDLSGLGNNGALTNSPIYNSINPAAFTFNGSNTYVDCGNSTSCQLTTAVTLETWCNPTSSTGLGNMIQKNSNSAYRIRIQNGDLWSYSAANSIVTSGAPCTNGLWWHCVATFGPSGLGLYLNGVLVASNSTAYAPSDAFNGNVQIGCFSPGNEIFNGKISVAKIYNRVLSASEVLQNFFAHRSRFGI